MLLLISTCTLLRLIEIKNTAYDFVYLTVNDVKSEIEVIEYFVNVIDQYDRYSDVISY